MPPEVSIIIATFNEEKTIAACLDALIAVFPQNAEFLVVDGGHDRTAAVVAEKAGEHPGIRYIRNENDRGKGHAIRTGIAQARAPLHAQFDADLQFFATDLPALLAPLMENRADLVCGSRFLPASGRDEHAEWRRSFGNRLVSAYASLLFGQRFTDVLAGIKTWTRQAAEVIALQSDTYSYEVELPTKGRRRGLRVMDLPISTQVRQGGDSKVNVLASGLRMFRDITLFRLGWK